MAQAKLTIFFLIFLITSLSSKQLNVEAGHHQINTIPEFSILVNTMAEQPQILHKNGVASKSRKLLEEEVVQPDYDDPGPNPKHDPRKGKGGGKIP